MIKPLFIGPFGFWNELIYTILIVMMCFLIYVKTKEIYELTKHKAIKYFRTAFLFFGLAYLTGFILHMFSFTIRFLDIYFPRHIMFPIVMIPVSYFGTMAIFYISYSTIWKRIKWKYFFLFSNIMAIFVSATAFISRSPLLIALIQLLLLFFTIIILVIKKKKTKKIHTISLYYLVSLFWLVNLFAINPSRFLPIEIKIILEIVSVLVLGIIVYKVLKWVK